LLNGRSSASYAGVKFPNSSSIHGGTPFTSSQLLSVLTASLHLMSPCDQWLLALLIFRCKLC